MGALIGGEERTGKVEKRKRVVTKEVIKTMALARGVELSDQRAEELIPELTTVVEGLDALLSMLEDSKLEPSLVFHVPGQAKHVG